MENDPIISEYYASIRQEVRDALRKYMFSSVLNTFELPKYQHVDLPDDFLAKVTEEHGLSEATAREQIRNTGLIYNEEREKLLKQMYASTTPAERAMKWFENICFLSKSEFSLTKLKKDNIQTQDVKEKKVGNAQAEDFQRPSCSKSRDPNPFVTRKRRANDERSLLKKVLRGNFLKEEYHYEEHEGATERKRARKMCKFIIEERLQVKMECEGSKEDEELNFKLGENDL